MHFKSLRIFIATGFILGNIFHCNLIKKKTDASKNEFSDTFNRSDGSPGAQYTAYLPSNANFFITQDRLQPVFNGAEPAIYYNSKTFSDVKISATFQISGGSYTGPGFILGRAATDTDMNSTYVCGYYNATLALGKYASGMLTLFGNITLNSTADGQSDPVTFTLNQGTLTCEITAGVNQSSISVADTTYTSGYVGLTGGNSSGNYLFFTSFSIDDL